MKNNESKLFKLLDQVNIFKITNPSVAIILLGIFCEQLCKEVLLLNGYKDIDGLDHFGRIMVLDQEHNVQKDIIEILHKIRILRNEVLHQAKLVSAEELHGIIIESDKLVRWYLGAQATGMVSADLNDRTLHEAMVLVLSESPEKALSIKYISEEIYQRRLYLKKDGTQATPKQIRARACKYGHLFEIIPKAMIKLRS